MQRLPADERTLERDERLGRRVANRRVPVRCGKNALTLVVATDVRRVNGYQDFVDEAPLDLVYVADHTRMRLVPAGQRDSYSSAAAGAICQNVYLYAAANGLAKVIRAWIDRDAIAEAIGLTHDQQVLFSQTVGYPKR